MLMELQEESESLGSYPTLDYLCSERCSRNDKKVLYIIGELEEEQYAFTIIFIKEMTYNQIDTLLEKVTKRINMIKESYSHDQNENQNIIDCYNKLFPNEKMKNWNDRYKHFEDENHAIGMLSTRNLIERHVHVYGANRLRIQNFENLEDRLNSDYGRFNNHKDFVQLSRGYIYPALETPPPSMPITNTNNAKTKTLLIIGEHSQDYSEYKIFYLKVVSKNELRTLSEKIDIRAEYLWNNYKNILDNVNMENMARYYNLLFPREQIKGWEERFNHTQDLNHAVGMLVMMGFYEEPNIFFQVFSGNIQFEDEHDISKSRYLDMKHNKSGRTLRLWLNSYTNYSKDAIDYLDTLCYEMVLIKK